MNLRIILKQYFYHTIIITKEKKKPKIIGQGRRLGGPTALKCNLSSHTSWVALGKKKKKTLAFRCFTASHWPGSSSEKA